MVLKKIKRTSGGSWGLYTPSVGQYIYKKEQYKYLSYFIEIFQIILMSVLECYGIFHTCLVSTQNKLWDTKIGNTFDNTFW